MVYLELVDHEPVVSPLASRERREDAADEALRLPDPSAVGHRAEPRSTLSGVLFLIALLLAIFVLPSPWGIVAVVGAAALDIIEIGVGLWWSKRRKATVGVDTLVGATGVAVGELWPDGQVKVNGEIWGARCDGGLRRGHVGRRAGGRRADARGGAGLRCRARRRVLVGAAAALALATAGGRGDVARGRTRAPLPLPRTEVSAAVVGSEIVVLGGLTDDGGASRRVDAYSPARDTWRRLPDLPRRRPPLDCGRREREAVRPRRVHGRAARRCRSAFVLERGAWRRLARMPFPRAAAGAAVAGRRIVVAGGIGEGRRLARNALSFDLATRRWSVVAGPTPREHLGVTSFAGTVYAVGGRTAGLDTNLLHFESYRPGDRGWRRLQPVPDPRGGTGAAALAGQVVSVGGEEPGGTIARGARVPHRGEALGAAAGPADAASRRRASPRSADGSS